MARHVLAGAILLSIVASGAAYAFGTITQFGQDREHERITRHALTCVAAPQGPAAVANCFQARSLDEIAGKPGTYGGVGAPDDVTRGLITSDAAHCDNGDYLTDAEYHSAAPYPTQQATAQATLLSCRAWMDTHLDAAVTQARALVVNGAVDGAQIPTLGMTCTFSGKGGLAKCNVLEEFGLTLHASEDFYSHSNWTDIPDPNQWIGIKNPPGLGNTGKAPWLDLRVNPAPWPAGLISGCFVLVPEFLYCNQGKGRTKHDNLNKDKGQIDPSWGPSKTDRGQVQGNFRRAVEAAIDDTKDKWKILQERIMTTYPNDGAMMICAISHDDPVRDCAPARQRTGSVTMHSIVLLGMFAFFAMYQFFGGSLWSGLRGSRPASGRAA